MGYAFAAPTAVILAEKFSARRVVLCGSLVAFIGISLSSLAINIVYIIFMFGVCFGIGNATVYGNGLVIIGRYFRKRRSLATSLAVAGGSVGQFALPPLIEFVRERHKVEGALLIIGALYLHTAIAGMLFRP